MSINNYDIIQVHVILLACTMVLCLAGSLKMESKQGVNDMVPGNQPYSKAT